MGCGAREISKAMQRSPVRFRASASSRQRRQLRAELGDARALLRARRVDRGMRGDVALERRRRGIAFVFGLFFGALAASLFFIL